MNRYEITSWTGHKNIIDADTIRAALSIHGYTFQYDENGEFTDPNGIMFYGDENEAAIVNRHGDSCGRIAIILPEATEEKISRAAEAVLYFASAFGCDESVSAISRNYVSVQFPFADKAQEFATAMEALRTTMNPSIRKVETPTEFDVTVILDPTKF